MTSAINTAALDANYPVPGVNNNSEGFRTNFLNIKNNLNTAATEIGELQTNGIFKSALSGTTLNNNMGNSLISNATIQGFSQTTKNIGVISNGTIIIDKSLGDFQYGTVSANITSMNFTGWGPSGNYSEVIVQLSVQPGQTITVPPTVGIGSLLTIEGASGYTITVPANTYQLTYVFSTIDCGTSLNIQQVNRPRQATQVLTRSISTNQNGSNGDQPGAIAYDNGNLWLCYLPYTGSGNIWKQLGTGGGGGTSLTNGNTSLNVNPSSIIGTVNSSTILAINPSNVTITGNANVTGFLNSAGANLGPNTNVRITGGVAGQFLRTDGNGNLSWANVGSGGSTAPGGNAGQIQFNNNGSFGGVPNFFTLANGDLSTANLTVTNNLTSTANLFAGNIRANGTITANSISTTGSSPITITSASTIAITPSANSDVTIGNNGNTIINGALYVSNANLFLTRVTAAPTTSGAIGQTQLVIYGNGVTQLCVYNGFIWKSVTLT